MTIYKSVATFVTELFADLIDHILIHVVWQLTEMK